MKKLLRNGALILFVLSIIIFIGILTYQLLLLRGLYDQTAMGIVRRSAPQMWVLVIAAVSGALSAAAIPFFGACIIDRADRIVERQSEDPRA